MDAAPKAPKMSDIRAPAGADPRWEGWSAPILAFLSEPRTWDQLNEWRKETKTNGSLLRHCLAWLEDQGRARSILIGEDRDVIAWVRLGAEPEEPS